MFNLKPKNKMNNEEKENAKKEVLRNEGVIQCYSMFLYKYVNEYLNCNADTLPHFLNELDNNFNDEFGEEVVRIAELIKRKTEKK